MKLAENERSAVVQVMAIKNMIEAQEKEKERNAKEASVAMAA